MHTQAACVHWDGWTCSQASLHRPVMGRRCSEEAWSVASCLVQAMPSVLTLSLVAEASLHVPPQSWSGKLQVKIQVKEQGGNTTRKLG